MDLNVPIGISFLGEGTITTLLPFLNFAWLPLWETKVKPLVNPHCRPAHILYADISPGLSGRPSRIPYADHLSYGRENKEFFILWEKKRTSLVIR